jgi:hypothetical protein
MTVGEGANAAPLKPACEKCGPSLGGPGRADLALADLALADRRLGLSRTRRRELSIEATRRWAARQMRPNWQDPPPPGGWDGPPPPGGWNSPWNGPPRYVAQAQGDFGPFNFDGYTAIPVFNPVFGGWGFWFFGVWIPLY